MEPTIVAAATFLSRVLLSSGVSGRSACIVSLFLVCVFIIPGGMDLSLPVLSTDSLRGPLRRGGARCAVAQARRSALHPTWPGYGRLHHAAGRWRGPRRPPPP